LKKWVASVGRTRRGSSRQPFIRKDHGGRASSRRVEAPSTWVSRSNASDGAREAVHLAWTTGRTGSGGERTLRSFRARLKALRVKAGAFLIGRTTFDPWPSGSMVRRRSSRAALPQRAMALESFDRARAVTGSVRDGRQTAKAPPAERRGGSALAASAQRVAATWTADDAAASASLAFCRQADRANTSVILGRSSRREPSGSADEAHSGR